MRVLEQLRQAQRSATRSLGVFIRDTGHGLLEIGHNALAFTGLLVVAAVVFAAGRDDLRHQVETYALQWLQTRHEARALSNGDVLTSVADEDGVQRATAIDPAKLPQDQASVARWISRRYKVAPEPVGRLVHEAWAIGRRAGIEPTLILAIMAVESSFNPFAQSPMGAQGLMQVMTRIHDDKYEAFGGTHAAFDPVSNLRVGVQVLKECIARAGNLQDGLRRYVGSVSDDDGGYASKVLAEQARLRDVAAGKPVPVTTTSAPSQPVTPAREAAAEPPDVPSIATKAEQVAVLR